MANDSAKTTQELPMVNTSAQSLVVDTKSPYYLYPSNHPGLIFASHPLNENGQNYFAWRKNLLNALRSKNKTCFLDGTIEKPDVDSQDYQLWEQCNAIVLAWLMNALSKELQGSTTYADIAGEGWLDLQDRFTQGMDVRIYELRRSIALLRQQKTSISAYYGKLKSIWSELQSFDPVPICTCGGCRCGLTKRIEDMRENDKVFNFLMGLDESFGAVRSQILTGTKLRTPLLRRRRNKSSWLSGEVLALKHQSWLL